MIGLGSTFIIMACSIYLIVEGNEKNDSTKFYGGIIAAILSIFLMCLVIQNIKNTENMGKIYKFKRLNEMKLDDYGFGLFEYNGALYFKEADEGKCFDVRSGNEVIIGRTRKRSVRHSWVKAGPGIQRCAICGITKQSEWRDGKTSHCVYLSSGELYSITGETPECRDLSEFY